MIASKDAPEPSVLPGKTEAESTTVQSPPSHDSSTDSRKLNFFHWHDAATSREEKHFLFKLDFYLLTYACLSFFVKMLDQTNVTNAYSSGMAEDLAFGPGNELSWMNTYFQIGTLIGSPFGNLVMSKVRPRYWLPFCMATWSFFVLFLYKCNTAPQFYVMRFFIGFWESSAWPGIHYLLGAWYLKSEIGRRSALFVISSILGQMFSGYLQAALFSGMDGKLGLAAWRWLFIFDFIIGIPVIIYGICVIPDTPHKTKAFWLNDWERQHACDRIESEGRKPIGKLDWTVFRRIFTSWQVYAFSLGFMLWQLTCAGYTIQAFTIYLRKQGYAIVDVNNIPTAQPAFNVLVMFTTGWVSDKLRDRRPAFLVIGTLLTVCYAVMTAWYVPHGVRIFFFILIGVYGSFTPLMAGWINEACGGDDEKRGFILGFTMSVGGAVQIPFQQLQWPSSLAPAYRETHGWASALVFVVALTLWTGFGISFVQKWAQKREATEKVAAEGA
ncbi:permease of the major facilitator superfamily [Plectosphaerella cucumerina]|uniref:Permease of the major facilitator superfamily n=1 Tax=Plectosphaerella cucumerina TaxID=40658 RepID=A0A8K0TCT4_9PEZI|nr:permease of the major facilitator superfamily [Plectosphaerella cucumerina]